MYISNWFVAESHRLSNRTGNPQRVYNAMRHTIRTTIKMLKAISVLDLFNKLVQNQMALTNVKRTAYKLCKGLKEDKSRIIANQIMKWKLQDANKQVKHMKWMHTKVLRENEKRTTTKLRRINEKQQQQFQKEKTKMMQ